MSMTEKRTDVTARVEQPTPHECLTSDCPDCKRDSVFCICGKKVNHPWTAELEALKLENMKLRLEIARLHVKPTVDAERQGENPNGDHMNIRFKSAAPVVEQRELREIAQMHVDFELMTATAFDEKYPKFAWMSVEQLREVMTKKLADALAASQRTEGEGQPK